MNPIDIYYSVAYSCGLYWSIRGVWENWHDKEYEFNICQQFLFVVVIFVVCSIPVISLVPIYATVYVTVAAINRKLNKIRDFVSEK